jgi:hypothetical protein
MNGNPFRTSEVDLSRMRTAPSVDWQPYAFAAVPVLLSLGLLLISIVGNWHWWNGRLFETDLLLSIVSRRVIEVLPACAGVLLYVRWECERHAIVRYQSLAVLLTAFALTYGAGVLGLAGGVWYGMRLGLLPVSRLGDDLLPLIALAPLWLILRLARSRIERRMPGDGGCMGGWQVTFAVALCVTVIFVKALEYFFILQIQHYNGYVQLLIGGVCGAVVLASGWDCLPAWVPSFPVGRILLCAAIIALLCGSITVLCSWGAWQLLSDVANNRVADWVLPPLALGLLALLWPITRLALRLCFGRQWLAQSSPR